MFELTDLNALHMLPYVLLGGSYCHAIFEKKENLCPVVTVTLIVYLAHEVFPLGILLDCQPFSVAFSSYFHSQCFLQTLDFYIMPA